MLATRTSGPGEPCEGMHVSVESGSWQNTSMYEVNHVLGEVYIEEVEI
jgi:hypothetical protein